MQLKSLGLNTEIFFYSLNSKVEQQSNYIKIETPNNPNYYWGNLLIYSHPPREDEVEIWLNDFEKEFENCPNVKHITFTWDPFGEKPFLKTFQDLGFQVEETIVLNSSSINLEYVNKDFSYRKIESQSDWDQVIELQTLIGIETEKYIPELYKNFVQKRFVEYQKLVSKNYGAWFGAFDKDILVADLGLFGNSDFKRFQSIETKIEYRKKGIIQNLIKYSTEQIPSKQYVIHATQNGPAIDLYMRLGFQIKEVLTGVCLFNKDTKYR